MKKRDFARLAAAVALFAFVAGAASVRLFAPGRAIAQDAGDVRSVAEMAVVDNEGGLRMLLTTNEGDGAPMIAMYSKDGTGKAVYSLSGAGEPSIVMNNGAGDMRLVFAVLDDGGPGALLKDKAGKNIWRAP